MSIIIEIESDNDVALSPVRTKSGKGFYAGGKVTIDGVRHQVGVNITPIAEKTDEQKLEAKKNRVAQSAVSTLSLADLEKLVAAEKAKQAAKATTPATK